MKTYEFVELAKGDLTKVETSVLRELHDALWSIASDIEDEISAETIDPAEEEKNFKLLDKVNEEIRRRIEIRNLTPHSITFVDDAGNVIKTIEPSGIVARVSAKTEQDGALGGIPTSYTSYGEVVDLPAPEDGIVYVVSSLVAARVPERDDVYIPAESVRDAAGRIVGCKSLGRI